MGLVIKQKTVFMVTKIMTQKNSNFPPILRFDAVAPVRERDREKEKEVHTHARAFSTTSALCNVFEGSYRSTQAYNAFGADVKFIQLRSLRSLRDYYYITI